MMKLTNCVLAAMLAAPFAITYLRKWQYHRWVRMKPLKQAQDSDADVTDSEDDSQPEVETDHYIRIPAFAVAAVIGKRGVTLRRLMYDSQTECVIRSYTPEELDVAEYFAPDVDWRDKFETDDWFSDESADTRRKITYLVVRTNDEKKLQMVRLRIAEIIEVVKTPWKESEFLVDSHMVGYLVGRGGRNIKNLRDKFSVQIQISEPNPDNPEKSTVYVRGRDAMAMKQVEIVMRETVLPRNYDRVPRYDEDTLIENGIYESVDQELEDLKRAAELLSRGFV